MRDHYLWGPLLRRIPPVSSVLPDTIPVPVFGNPWTSSVATIGINPSHGEYESPSGGRHEGPDKRLPSPSQVGAARLTDLDDDGVAVMAAGLIGYFEANPYSWFETLSRVLDGVFDVTYGNGACHLDIVHWATRPAWDDKGGLSARDKQALLDESHPHLQTLLDSSEVEVVLCNGITVVNQVIGAGLADLAQVGTVQLGTRAARLFAAVARDVVWVGWSANLQGNWVPHHLIDGPLCDAVASLCAQRLGPQHTDGPTPDGGACSEVTWFDSQGSPTTRKRAVAGEVTTYDADGVAIQRTYATVTSTSADSGPRTPAEAANIDVPYQDLAYDDGGHDESKKAWDVYAMNADGQMVLATTLDLLGAAFSWPDATSQRARALADLIALPSWAGAPVALKAEAKAYLTEHLSHLERLVRITRNVTFDRRVMILAAFPYQGSPHPTAAPSDPAWIAQVAAREETANTVRELYELTAAQILPLEVRDAVVARMAKS